MEIVNINAKGIITNKTGRRRPNRSESQLKNSEPGIAAQGTNEAIKATWAPLISRSVSN